MRTTNELTGDNGVTFNVAEIEASPLHDRFRVKKEGIGEHSITPMPNPHTKAKPVAGIDSLGLCAWVWWRPAYHRDFIEELEAAQELARERNTDVAIDWRGLTLQISPYGTRQGGGMPFRFICEGIYYAMSRKEEAGKRHNMQISVMGAGMMLHNWSAVEIWQKIQSHLQDFGIGGIMRHTVSRADIFADCPGIHVKQFRPIVRRNGFVCRARHMSSFSGIDRESVRDTIKRSYSQGLEAVICALRNLWGTMEKNALCAVLAEASQGTFDLIEFGKTDEDLGYQWGRGQMVCRVYNKLRQLEKFHPERLPAMRDAWCIGNDVPVTRIEYQLRGAPLRLRNLETVEQLTEALPSLVHELTHEWLVGTAKYDGKNKDRREIAPIWKRVQAYFKVGFRFRDGETPEKLERRKQIVRDNGHQLARMALGFVTTATARTAGPCHDPWDLRATVIDQLDNAADHYGGWGEMLWKQVNKAFQYENEMGQPFSGRTNRQIMQTLTNQLCASLDN